MTVIVVGFVTALVVLAVAEIVVKRAGVRNRKQHRELALLRITASRVDMGGIRVRKNPTYQRDEHNEGTQDRR